MAVVAAADETLDARLRASGGQPDDRENLRANTLHAQNTDRWIHLPVNAPRVVSFRPPGWNVNNTLHLRVIRWDRGTLLDVRFRRRPNDFRGDDEPSFVVDFGPYFDFPIPDDDDDASLPNSPENTSDVMGTRDRNLRRRTYRGRLVHSRYSMELFTRAQVEGPNKIPHLSDDSRLWSRNHFVFWANHGKLPERTFLAPVRRAMERRFEQLVRSGRGGRGRGGRGRGEGGRGEGGRGGGNEKLPEYVAWLHVPLLNAMRRLRRSTEARLKLLDEVPDPVANLPEIDGERADAIARRARLAESDETVVRKTFSDEGVDIVPREPGPWEGNAETLRLRTEASVWAFHNVFASEMRDQLTAMRLPELLEEVGDGDDGDDGDDANDVDTIEFRRFPVQSGWSHHWSSVATPVSNPERASFRTRTRYARFDAGGVRHATDVDIDDLFVDVRPHDDVLGQVLESELLVGGQLGALQSHVGTRAHFRASLVMSSAPDDDAIVGLGRPREDDDRFVALERTFFPGMAGKIARGDDRARPVSMFERVATNLDARFVWHRAHAFMTAEGETDVAAAKYTAFLVDERANGYARIRELIERAFPDDGPCSRFEVFGVEVPLYDPSRVYESTKGRYGFFTTQADFVALATFDDGRKKVIVGETKVLMERTTKTKTRVRDTRSQVQALYNAYLFQRQTSVEVGAILQLFLTRRDNPSFVAYGACVPFDARGTLGDHLRIRDGGRGEGTIVLTDDELRVETRRRPSREGEGRGGDAELPSFVLAGGGRETPRWFELGADLEIEMSAVAFRIRSRHADRGAGQRIARNQRAARRAAARRAGDGGGGDNDGGGGDNDGGGGDNDGGGGDNDGGGGDNDGGEGDNDGGGGNNGDGGGDNDGGGGQQQQIQGAPFVQAGIAQAPVGGGRSTFRTVPPSGFDLEARRYPRTEPNRNKDARLLLRDAIVEAANAVVETHPVSDRFDETVRSAQANEPNAGRAFRWWSRRLKSVPRFGAIARVHAAGGADVPSGERMTGANRFPTEAEFYAKPDAVLRGLVVRATHRFVDDFVLRAIELLDPDSAVTRDGLDKVELTKKFIHNSQRAYWRLAVTNWAREQIVPAARNEIVLILT